MTQAGDHMTAAATRLATIARAAAGFHIYNLCFF